MTDTTPRPLCLRGISPRIGLVALLLRGAIGASLLLLCWPVLAQDPEPVDEALQDYVSVGTKLTRPAQRHPGSVVVISADEIARMGYRSVGEALRSVPGLYVSYDLRNYHVAIRGIFGGARAGSRALKVLINGRPFSFVQSGVYFLGPELVPIDSVERIEVLKGPASVAYGAGALVGAINIVTKRPPYEGSTKLGARLLAAGGLGDERGGLGNASVSLTSRALFAFLGVSGAFFSRSGLELVDSSPILISARPELRGVESVNDYARPIGAIARLEYTLAGGRLSLDVLSQLYDYDGEFHDQSPLSHVLGDGTRTRLFHWKGVLGYERAFASGLSLLAQLGVAHGLPVREDQIRLPSLANPRTQDFSYLETSGQLEARFELASQANLLAGFDFSVDQETLSSYFELLPDGTERRLPTVPESAPEETLTNLAGYATVFWPLARWVQLSAGLRLDWHNIYNEALSAHAGVVLPVADALTFKLVFGRSYKAPSAEQLFGVAQDVSDIVGNRALEPSFLTSGEVVIDYFVTRSLNVSASLFVNQLDDGIAYVLRAREVNEFTPITYDAFSYGGELTVRHAQSLGPVRLLGSAAVALQSTETGEKELGGGRVNKPVPDNEAVPRLSGWARISLEIARLYAQVFLDFHYVGERTPSQTNLAEAGTPTLRDPIYMLDGYALLGAGASMLPVSLGGERTLSAVLRVSNVLAQEYAEIGFLGVDVPALGTTAWLQLRLAL